MDYTGLNPSALDKFAINFVKPSSRPSSISSSAPLNLQPNINITTFNFINWPRRLTNSVTKLVVAYTGLSPYIGSVLALTPLQHESTTIIIQITTPLLTKSMSMIQLEFFDIELVIEALLNNNFSQQVDFITYRRLMKMDDQTRTDNDLVDLYVKFGITEFYVYPTTSFSLTVPELIDIPTMSLNHISLI